MIIDDMKKILYTSTCEDIDKNKDKIYTLYKLLSEKEKGSAELIISDFARKYHNCKNSEKI